MLELTSKLPKRPLAHALASSWSCRHLFWAPLSWQLVTVSWVGREKKASNSGATGLTPVWSSDFRFALLFKTARLSLAFLGKFQETPVIVLSSREVLSQYVSPCLHRLLVCFSLVHDGGRVCQNCWLSAHEIWRAGWGAILLSYFLCVSQLVYLSHSSAQTLFGFFCVAGNPNTLLLVCFCFQAEPHMFKMTFLKLRLVSNSKSSKAGAVWHTLPYISDLCCILGLGRWGGEGRVQWYETPEVQRLLWCPHTKSELAALHVAYQCGFPGLTSPQPKSLSGRIRVPLWNAGCWCPCSALYGLHVFPMLLSNGWYLLVTFLDWKPEMKRGSVFTATSQLLLLIQLFWKKPRAFVLGTG